MKIKLNLENIQTGIQLSEVNALKEQMEKNNLLLHSGEGRGSDFLGWVNLPSSLTANDLKEIQDSADDLRSRCDVVVVIGIGGSYLGAKAVLDALNDSFEMYKKDSKNPIIIFAGHNISGNYAAELQRFLGDKNFGTIIISKSGTTTEPAIAFRYVKEMIEDKFGKEEAVKRIIAVTDAKRGALRDLATEKGYKTFVIPDDVGGRFSVLTPVGLLPLAVAGVDINSLVDGAKDMEALTGADVPYEKNISAQYAAARVSLYNKGKKVELLASFEPKLQYFNEWWKQLFGESEGKEGKGLFPTSVVLSTDLHSMGQYIQEGERILFETMLHVNKPESDFKIKEDKANLDKLNFIAGKYVSEVNEMAEAGTILAHVDGGVPNIKITLDRLDAKHVGGLIYFFEKACGISGYSIGVNPFDQPGVEAYKKNMFALLGKPGYEEETLKLKARL
ncbi:MAG: glucose-6-phosphate isomerase [Bacteroidetes bacterium]|nr:glucose-6-phosphate isomerase [Bacteroidota bacterium]